MAKKDDAAKLAEAWVPNYTREDARRVQERLNDFDQQIAEALAREITPDPNARMVEPPQEDDQPEAERLHAEREKYLAAEQKKADRKGYLLRELPFRHYQLLLDEHPPRQHDTGDARVGFNRETFHEALVRACVVKPDLPDEIPTGLMFRLIEKANELCNGDVVPFPKSLPASTLTTLREHVRRQLDEQE